jgi:uncharacterized protein
MGCLPLSPYKRVCQEEDKKIAERQAGNHPNKGAAAVWLLCFLLIWSISCREQLVEPETAETFPVADISPTSTLTPTAARPTARLLPTRTATAIPAATATPSPTPTATPRPTLTPTPDPYADLTLAALAARAYGGGELEIVEVMAETAAFTRYLITYPSDGLTIYGFMNVPHLGSQFPVAIVLHGYIPPGQYQTLAYTTRYADHLAANGYLVIHPNLRNYPPSDSGPDPFRTGYAADVLNLMAIIRAQSLDETGVLRRADRERIHLWGHSMGGGIALRVATVNNAPYLRSIVLYGSMSGDEALNYERIRQWSGGSSGQFERAATPAQLQAISPIYHLDRLQTAVAVHHSEADDVVPVEWSQDLCARLEALAHPVVCYFYEDLPHTFRGNGDLLFMERVAAFFDSHN